MAIVERPSLFDHLQPEHQIGSESDGRTFHPAVQTWFERSFPEGATPPQVEGWPSIAAGQHTLIAAPTGSGKTLAGFLVCIDRLYRAHACGQSVEDHTQVVYVSPLRALAVDISENLERPLQEIAEVARELGLKAPNLRIGVRTGDTTPSARAAMLRKPPNFVITTPESLYLLATGGRGRTLLNTVETLIVDEIHAMARDKRGAHLALTMERVESLADRTPVRVGLSATQRPVERVAELLTGTDRDCTIVDAGHLRTLDLAIELPGAELEAVASAEQMNDVLDRIAELVAEHRTTLVFVNTRRLAERLAHQLGERLGDDVVSAHHGSLSKDRRERVERRLRAGDLRALVATASLELGIDVGPVELVCQIGSPRSIATFLQRVGRSNHTRAGTPRGRLYPLTRDELVECSALLGAVRAGTLDAVEPPVKPLDILAQQVVAEVAGDEWSTDELYDRLRRAAPYADLERAEFDEVVELVSAGVETGRGRRAAYVYHDTVNGRLRPRKNARIAAATSGGAIPEIGDFRVVAEPDETFIGTVNEDWAIESMAGDIFLLGTHSWQIRRVSGGVVRVVDAGGKPPSVPFWTGEAPARTAELSEEVGRLRGTVDTYLAAGEGEAAKRWLVEATGVPEDAASMIVDYLAAGRAVLGVVPTGTELVFERFFDDSGGMQLVIHSPLGGRVNRALGLALRKRFCKSFNFELQASASDDAVVISLGPHHSFPLEDVPHFLHSNSVEDVLRQAVLDSPMFQSRWRWNLNRALTVLRFRNGKKNPPPIQRMESDDLMAALFPQAAACQENVSGPIEIPDHLLVRQTIHDTLNEGLDINGLRALLDGIENGRVKTHFCDSPEPSLLAHEILTAKPYAFLDADGEVQDRRTNAVSLRRGIPTDPSVLAAGLDQAVIEQVVEEARPTPETADELHDLLLDRILQPPLPALGEVFAELVASGRAGIIGPDGLWCAFERRAEAAAVLDLRDERSDDAPAPEDATAALLRGHLATLGPVTADALAERFGLPPSRVAIGLAVLEADGFAMQGPWLDDDTRTYWCARRLLARIHSLTRRRERSSVTTVTAQDYQRFVLRWHHLAPGCQLRGEVGLLEAIEQLQGHHAPAGAWEPGLLASRLEGYRPEWLDSLAHRGELSWLRLLPTSCTSEGRPSGATRATPVTLVFRGDLPWLLQATRPVRDAPTAEPELGAMSEIVAHLRTEGAAFVPDIAAATGRLPTDVIEGLWAAMARGLVTADGFEPVRALEQGRKPVVRRRSVSKLRRGAGDPVSAAGRWAAVPEPVEVPDRDDLAEAVADQLLRRWGVLFYDLAAHDGFALKWRELQWALRRLEDRGLVKGGRFVAGFSGEQYALPDAVAGLERVAKAPRTGERVIVNAADPANLTGLITPGPRVPAVRTKHVTYTDGIPEP